MVVNALTNKAEHEKQVRIENFIHSITRICTPNIFYTKSYDGKDINGNSKYKYKFFAMQSEQNKNELEYDFPYVTDITDIVATALNMKLSIKHDNTSSPETFIKYYDDLEHNIKYFLDEVNKQDEYKNYFRVRRVRT